MKLKSTLSLLLLCMAGYVFGQISVPGTPPSFTSKQFSQNVPVVTVPDLDMDAIHAEDLQDDAAGLPPRFGYPHPASYNLSNSGKWEKHPKGGQVWRLEIKAKDATSINLLYDDYWLPEGARLYIYSKDHKHIIGAFSSLNNKQSGAMGTGLVYGDDCVLEYYEPAEVAGMGRLSISTIVHGYKFIDVYGMGVEEDFGDSGGCQVNVNCPEGANWQDEKRAVALILVSGFRNCTGSLVNTTRGDCTPYFLTADHCIGSLDAITNPDASNYSFYWNYESPGCADGSDFLPPSTNGATLLANDSPSDFALFLLTESPADIAGTNPWFNGWDATFTPGSDGVGIHHPSGDIKKIATHTMVPLADDWFGSSPANSHWEIAWDATPNGHSVTEGGSSGSPLYNAAGRVIGQLHGGSSINCSDPANDPGIYGAVAYSWENNAATDNRRKLKPWLDPDDTGVLTLDGSYGTCEASCVAPGGLNATGITETTANLTWSAVADALSYDVRYRQSGTTAWTTFTGVAGTSQAISGLIACSEYEYQVLSNCDSSSSFYTFSATFLTDGCPCPVYCASVGSTTVDEWIDDAVVGPLSNPSGDNGGYINYTGTAVTATYMTGSTYNVSLTPGYTGTIYNEWFKIWIDYNQDGDFDDAGEEVYTSGAAVNTTVTGSFTVPASALPGTTGMRITMRWSSEPGPCDNFTYGEVEDYCITIDNGTVNCETPSGLNADISNWPTNFTVSWNAVTGATSYVVYGKRAGSAGAFQSVNASTNSRTIGGAVLKPNKTYEWRVQAICGPNSSDTSLSDFFTTPSSRLAQFEGLQLFPNPANSAVNISFNADAAGEIDVRVLDMLGKQHIAGTFDIFSGQNQLQLNTAELAPGTYLVQLVNGEQTDLIRMQIEH